MVEDPCIMIVFFRTNERDALEGRNVCGRFETAANGRELLRAKLQKKPSIRI